MFLITVKDDDDDDDDDFGQRLPPLHVYLKRVLDKYPEGGQIIKVSYVSTRYMIRLKSAV